MPSLILKNSSYTHLIALIRLVIQYRSVPVPVPFPAPCFSSCPSHSATGSTTESTDSFLKFKSYGFLCRIYVTYISGVFVLVIFDSLLKEFYGIMGQL